jgi:lysophospholipid acyltransferase (LPLAT)-like uncharacterized protein
VLRAFLGVVLGIVARVWLWTLRLELDVHSDLGAVAGSPWVLSFFHGTQWPLLAWRRRRPTLVMVSHSADGQLQSRALGFLGFLVVRGSSSRGGVRALAEIVRRLRGGGVDGAFAVDGPRGPYGEVKAGAIVAARRSGGALVPMGSAMRTGKVFVRAWDRFALAWPFTRVSGVLGAPVVPSGHDATDAAALSVAIRAANDRACALLARPAPRMVHSPSLSDISQRRVRRRPHAE